MSHARRGRRVLAVAACSAVLAVSAGCRRSPFQRPSGPPEPVANADRPKAPELAPVVAASPSLPRRTLPEAVQAASSAVAEAEAAADALATAEPVPTPMLDAALRRAEAAEDAQREPLRAIETALPARAPSPPPGNK